MLLLLLHLAGHTPGDDGLEVCGALGRAEVNFSIECYSHESTCQRLGVIMLKQGEGSDGTCTS